ncbi:hypothetical protein HYY69_03970 [Candidatus Woesearchaeota archaeon]|nr:hypothetical protein [Candidatus Woesearchaeota archaeon]
MFIFEITDITGRKIHLTKERWQHIIHEHPNVCVIDNLISIITNPLKITDSKYNPENVKYYYQFDKNKKQYLMVAVKYLNGEGFIITAYYMGNIQ